MIKSLCLFSRIFMAGYLTCFLMANAMQDDAIKEHPERPPLTHINASDGALENLTREQFRLTVEGIPPTVEHLDISNNDLPHHRARGFLQLNLPLEYLDLSGNPLFIRDKKNVDQFSKHLPVTLKCFNIASCQLNPWQVKLLISDLPCLQTVDLSHNALGSKGRFNYYEIGQVLSRSLITLNLANNQLGVHQLIALLRGFSGENLLTLILDENNLHAGPKENLTRLAAFFPCSLRSVTLIGMPFLTETLSTFSFALTTRNPAIEITASSTGISQKPYPHAKFKKRRNPVRKPQQTLSQHIKEELKKTDVSPD